MNLYNILLVLHIIGGFTALTVGFLSIVSAKGRTLHRVTGKVFFFSMLAVAFSAITISLMKTNWFLFHLGIFTLYMNVAGRRSIQYKTLHPSLFDWLLFVGTTVNTIFMLFSGETILMVFGGISLTLLLLDTRIYYQIFIQKQLTANNWLKRHIWMMLGTYLSTFTAFLVVNIDLGAWNWMVWLLPTFLVTPLIFYWVRSVRKKTIRVTLSFLLVLCIGNILEAQIYVEKQTRHRFAQLNLGMDLQASFGGKTTYLDQFNRLQDLELATFVKPRFIIGGTHFWGHADIYVAFPIAYPSFENDEIEAFYGSSVETGFKIYPWRIENNKLRPYIGTSLSYFYFEQDSKTQRRLSDGSDIGIAAPPITAGFTFNKGKHLFDLNLVYNALNKKDYFVTPDLQQEIALPPLYVALGYKFMFDTTLSAEENWESGRTKKVTDKLGAAGKLNSFFIGLGPSSSTTVRRSSFNNANRPYFGTPTTSIFIDAAIGYHFHKLDMNIALSWRKFSAGNKAFLVQQISRRNSFGLEVTKNLLDFHGFVPYIGPCLSYERLAFEEYLDGQIRTNVKENKPALGITFGWDILPNRLQSFVLRTNLRYFPNLNLELPEGEKIAFDNIEFNFIQLIIYPSRMF